MFACEWESLGTRLIAHPHALAAFPGSQDRERGRGEIYFISKLWQLGGLHTKLHFTTQVEKIN